MNDRNLFGKWEAAAEGIFYGVAIVCGSYLLVQVVRLVLR